MEKTEENVNGTTEQSAAPERDAEPSLGKFKSVDALLRAYGELEAEFTRRSQKLKAFEEANKEKQDPSPVGQAQIAPSEELYRAAMQDESVKARILSDYLDSLKGVPLLSGSGTGVSAPADRPKSIAEAGKLALNYLKTAK